MINLIGLPNGGTFSGSGIIGNAFYPSNASPGLNSVTYSYTDSNGCSNSNLQTTTINTIPAVSFSGLSNDYCINSATSDLTGNPSGGTFSGDGISGNIFNPTVAGTGSNLVMYTYINSNGCSNSDTQLVTIHSLPVVNFSGLDSGYCVNGQSSVLTGSPAGGAFSGNGISGTLFNPSAALTGINNITYNYTDANGCSNNVMYSTTVIPLPTLDINGNSVICAGETESLSASGIGDLLWSTGENSSTINVSPTSTTMYFANATNVCGAIADSLLMIVNPLPSFEISNNDTTILLGSNVQLNVSGAITFSWSPSSGLSCTTCSNPVATPVVTTTYTVTGTSGDGCSDTRSITIKVNSEFEIFVPDIFSPNNDGQNDILFVRGNGIKELNFRVYDRLGEKIFESTDQSVGWDGSFKGRDLNGSVFVYYLSVKMIDGREVKSKGDITLIK
jgi:gliding motility-associated-like protein